MIPSHRPLQGIKILDLSRLLPGPFCSYLLQKLGAEVTSVVPPDSIEEVLSFTSLQKNKKRIRLNLKENKDYLKFEQLVRQSDVVLEGFRPGVLKRLKISFDFLKKMNRKIVLCSIAGYGQRGKDLAGHDLNYLAVSGFLSALTGESLAWIPGVPLADLMGGALAALQIVASLIIPKKSRKAIWLDISMVEALKTFLVPLEGGMKEKLSSVCTGGLARYHLYRTRDEQMIAVAPLEEKFWNQFVREMKIPPKVMKKGEKETIRWLEKKFRQKDRKEWLDCLSHPDLCTTAVL